METEISKLLSKPIKTKQNTDIILSNNYLNEISKANKLKTLQMSLGRIHELCATFYNWEKVPKIDLVDNNRKIALELKNRDNTDNSSSRYRNCEKLIEFKQNNPDYELYYICINSPKKQNEKNIEFKGEKITFLFNEKALEFLYGSNYQNVINIIKKCILESSIIKEEDF